MDTSTPSDTPTGNLSFAQVLAVGLFCGLLSFGMFYNLVHSQPGQAPQQVGSTASPEAIAVHLKP